MTTMKRFSFLLAPALLLSACAAEVTDDGLPEDSGTPIAFQAPQTRAAIEGTADMTAFSVWGGYDNDATNVFNGKEVTQSGGNWTYQGLQYWISGKTYDFYAVYPANLSKASVSSNGVITVTDFDASQTGEDAVDLMTASKAGMSGDDAKTVAFTFQHLLARVQIKVQAEGGTANITKATLSGIHAGGSYDSSNASSPWTLTKDAHDFTASGQSATSIPSSLFDDMLLPPQTVDGFSLSITYSFASGTSDTKQITLPTDVISQWQAGQSYTYTLTLSSNYISFAVPEVNEWGEASGGIIIVD